MAFEALSIPKFSWVRVLILQNKGPTASYPLFRVRWRRLSFLSLRNHDLAYIYSQPVSSRLTPRLFHKSCKALLLLLLLLFFFHLCHHRGGRHPRILGSLGSFALSLFRSLSLLQSSRAVLSPHVLTLSTHMRLFPNNSPKVRCVCLMQR